MQSLVTKTAIATSHSDPRPLPAVAVYNTCEVCSSVETTTSLDKLKTSGLVVIDVPVAQSQAYALLGLVN